MARTSERVETISKGQAIGRDFAEKRAPAMRSSKRRLPEDTCVFSCQTRVSCWEDDERSIVTGDRGGAPWVREGGGGAGGNCPVDCTSDTDCVAGLICDTATGECVVGSGGAGGMGTGGMGTGTGGA